MGVSTSCQIGTTHGGLATLSSLDITAPLASYLPGVPIKMASGAVVWRGFPSARWKWPFLSQTEIDILRAAYCTGASASIFIVTPVNDGRTYTEFEGVIIWPEDESGTDFILDFNQLVVYTT